MVRDNVKLREVFEDLAPEHQAIIHGMIDKSGGDQTEITVGETLKLVPIPDMEQQEKMAVLALMGVNNGKYVPKLNHEKRCQVLALYRSKVTREALSKMFNIDSRTVGHIYNPSSKHYKTVREEEKMLGTERFVKKYITDELLSLAMSYRITAAQVAEKNNRNAKGEAGVHVIRPKNCIMEHRLFVAWRDEEGVIPGWYYQDMDGDFPEAWLRGDADSMRTSRECYVYALNHVSDPIA